MEYMLKFKMKSTHHSPTFDKDIPKEGDPTDFAIYAHIQAFVNVFERTTTQRSIQEMKQMLAEFGIEKWSRKWHDKI